MVLPDLDVLLKGPDGPKRLSNLSVLNAECWLRRPVVLVS
jgi:hypothetical protein